MKKCFVISPIGEEGSEIRKDADNAFKYVIHPAMKACNIEAFRSDHLDKPGRISEQMFHAIFNSDLCIVDLTNYNPNVFYELAVAQSANRPVIIIIRKGHPLPFDVSDLRCVYYDMDINAFTEKTYINRVISYIEEFERSDWKVDDLFKSYKPKSQDQTLQIQALESSADYGTNKEWLKLLSVTRETFDLMGVGLLSWRTNASFKDAVLAKATSGCKVRILLMHEDHPSLHELTTNLPLMKESLPHTFEFFSRLAEQQPNIEVRRISSGLPTVFLTITDETAIVVQYLTSTKWGSGPLYKIDANNAMYQTYCREFESFWNNNGDETRLEADE